MTGGLPPGANISREPGQSGYPTCPECEYVITDDDAHGEDCSRSGEGPEELTGRSGGGE